MESLNFLIAAHNQMESNRIILRPVSLEDAEDMFEYTSDEETTKFVFEKHTDLNQTKQLIANYFMKEPIGKYGVILKESNKLIGTLEFRATESNKSGELGFILNRNFWGKGYMTEAGKLVLELAFRVLNLERVYAMHDTRNTASGKLMHRLGMTHEGTLRKDHMTKNTLADSAHYSILKEEFEI